MQDMEHLTDEDLQIQLAERLHVFATRLSRLAHEQVGKRKEIENRWLDDLRLFHGEYGPNEVAKMDGSGSQVFVNITRNKTNAAEARLQDMLFPTDDKNWGIRPTPVPELDRIKPGQAMMTSDGQAVDAGKMADEIMRMAKDKASAMELEIDDQLKESRYQIKARDIIHDACQLGTAVMKGPIIIGRTKKRWDDLGDGTSVLQVEESLDPTVERVDPWDFFPDMSARTIDEAEFIFERRLLSKKQLREMAKLPGILTEQLREVVRGGSDSTHIAKDYVDDIRAITGINTVGTSTKYEVWEYHGPISKSELMDALELAEEGMDLDEDELDDEIEAVVFFSGNHVLKVALNPMETNDRPYSVFNWEKDESSVFGFGVPYLMRGPQRIINSSWRMMMDNGGLSVADQIVVNRELVTPADGNWKMGPKKVWWLKDKTRGVNEAFAAFSTPSHQAELANIFQMARQLADEETNLPLIAQGEQDNHVTKTASGMSMLMNSANIVLRRAVKNWDDDVTRPLIGRFYDWNMQFSNKSDIKGDFSVDARGSGALLVREKQQENLMIYANISAGNPELALRRDWAGLDREIAKSLEVPYETLTRTDAEIEEIRQSQAQAPDPVTLDMQLKQAQLQLEQQRMQLDQQRMQMDAEIKKIEMQHKMQRDQLDAQLDQARLQQDRELKVAELASKANMTREQLAARMAIDSKKVQTDREKAAGDLNVKLSTAQMQMQNLNKGFDTF